MEAHHQTGQTKRQVSMVVRGFQCIIKAYQLGISPLLGPRCRFYPTCSCYANEALATHGLIKGLRLSIARICKCHPFHPGGVDLVPSKRSLHSGK